MDNIECETKFCEMMMGELLSRGEPIVTANDECPMTGIDVTECDCVACVKIDFSYPI